MPLSPLVEVGGFLRQDRECGTIVIVDDADWRRLGVQPGELAYVVVDERSANAQVVEAIARRNGWLALGCVLRALSPWVRVRKARRIMELK